MKIKLVITDVDGCMTDGSVVYTPNHEKFKIFNMQDGMGTKQLKEEGILTGIISSDNSDATKWRAEDLRMDIICINIKDKLEKLYEILEEYHISMEEVAYMGDDIQDLPILEKVGFPCAPKNAVSEVKDKVKYITEKNGGDGAYREFAEYILKINGGN